MFQINLTWFLGMTSPHTHTPAPCVATWRLLFSWGMVSRMKLCCSWSLSGYSFRTVIGDLQMPVGSRTDVVKADSHCLSSWYLGIFNCEGDELGEVGRHSCSVPARTEPSGCMMTYFPTGQSAILSYAAAPQGSSQSWGKLPLPIFSG